MDPSIPEYARLQEEECRSLLRLLEEMGIATADRTYGPGDAVYRQGEYGDALYVLVSGVMKLFRPYSGSKEATLRLLRSWDIFGHLAFAGEARPRAHAEAVTQSAGPRWRALGVRGGARRRAYAGAVTDCVVTKVPKIFVERAVRQEPRVAFKIMTLLELRLVQYEELVKCLLPRETEVRLANLLPLLAQKFGERQDGAVIIDLRPTHQDLAAMVASTRESVTKVLNEMRGRDLIEVEAGRITLTDWRALAALSGG